MKPVLITTLALLALSAPLAAQQEKAQMSYGKMMLQQLDADKNGSVSEQEYIKPQLAEMQKQFKHMDKDGNGAVSEAEADAFAKEMQEQMQRMREQQQQQQPQR